MQSTSKTIGIEHKDQLLDITITGFKDVVGAPEAVASAAKIITDALAPPQDIECGQLWYARMPGATALCTIRINDLTQETIFLQEMSFAKTCGRYKRSDIELVEAVNPANTIE